jgi:spermidine synthase
MDVVEIDPKITEIARKYFYLDKLIKDFNLEENGRLKLMNEDGRTYLNNNNIEYDAILNDAFSGDNPAKTLTTIENIRNIKKSLKKD